jgi:hypothetical protein
MFLQTGEGGKDGRRGDPRLSYPILLDSASKVIFPPSRMLLGSVNGGS